MALNLMQATVCSLKRPSLPKSLCLFHQLTLQGQPHLRCTSRCLSKVLSPWTQNKQNSELVQIITGPCQASMNSKQRNPMSCINTRTFHWQSSARTWSEHETSSESLRTSDAPEQEGTDFRDMLNALVTECIEDEDKGFLRSSTMEGDDDISVSQSGKMLMFPWRRWDSYKDILPDESGNKGKGKRKPPSVTTILQKTMSPDSAMALLRWENFMIKKLGVAGFHKMKKEMFAEGHQLHKNIGCVLLNRPEEAEIGDKIKGYWNSVEAVLSELESDSTLLECHTKHPFLGYHGYADCVTNYRGKPCVVEFKTSRKPKHTLSKCFDNPLQVVAYTGSLNFDPKYQLQVDQALLVIAYRDGSPASLHLMDSKLCEVYWGKWLGRLQEYREMEGRYNAKNIETQGI